MQRRRRLEKWLHVQSSRRVRGVFVYKTEWLREALEQEIRRWESQRWYIPSNDDLDAVAQMLCGWTKLGKLSTALQGIVLPPGVSVSEVFEDYVIVYWEGDPAARALVSAGIEDLPALLTCEDPEIRELAGQKLEILKARTR